jgi:short-subunit dehydrogenase
VIVVVTGASSGIGRAAAIAWGKRGATLVLSARGAEALETVAREVREAGGEAVVEAGDVTDAGHCARLVERATRSFGGGDAGGIDVLVNNAGRGYYAAVRDVDPRELEALFALNVVAPLRLTQLALPALERSAAAAGHATVVMVSSIAGVVAAPRMGAYAASKFALEALAIALRAECAASGVRVVVVRPGPVDTPFRARSITKGVGAGVRPPGAEVQSPEEIARQIVAAVDRGRAVVETSGFVRAAGALSRIAPGVYRRVAARMAAKAQTPKE